MKWIFEQCVFVCLLLSHWHSAHAQNDIGKKEEHEIFQTCEAYFQQYERVLTNFDTPTDSLLHITSEILSDFILARRDFFRQMEYENLHFPQEQIISVELNDSVGCMVKGDPNFKLNLERQEDKWIVIGYDNHVINEEDINRFDSLYNLELKKLVIRDTIKQVVRDFVEGVSQLRESQNSDLLKANCTLPCYNYLVQKTKYDQIRDYNLRGSTIKKMEHVFIYSDSAECRVNIKGMGWGRINLLFREGHWLVAGENGDFWTENDAVLIEREIEQFKELAVFNERIELFNERFKSFFIDGNSAVLRDVATDNLIQDLEIYRNLAGTFDTSHVRLYGMDKAFSPEDEYAIYTDSAYYKCFSDSVQWVKRDNQWLLDQLFSSIHLEDRYDKAHRTFDTFTRLMSISHYRYADYDYIEVPPAPAMGTEEDVVMDTLYDHRLDTYGKKPLYSRGVEQLYADIKAATAKVANSTNFKGVIYVEFNVNNSGELSNIHALNRMDFLEAELAEEVVKQIGPWTHENTSRPRSSNMVIAVQF